MSVVRRLPREQSLAVLNVCGNSKGGYSIFFVTSQEYIPGFLIFFSTPFIFVFQGTTCCCSDGAPRLEGNILTLLKKTLNQKALFQLCFIQVNVAFHKLHFEIV